MSTKKATGRKKAEKWETLDLSNDKPEKLDIPPFNCMVQFKGQEFKAVGTHLDILGQRHVPYVAMLVMEGENVVNKMVEMDEAAHRFLVAQGLPITVAKALVTMAAAMRDETA
jgi:hypothetical protein